MKKGSSGGKKMAIIQRNNSLNKYYQNPNLCKFCDEVINVNEGQRVRDVKKKKFCNEKCSAKYNNKNRKKKIKLCKNNNCHNIVLVNDRKCKECKDIIAKQNLDKFLSLTKKELFEKYSHYSIARIRITKHSRSVFFKSGKKRECLFCGYSLHIDVAHVKGVRDFSEDSLIREINDLNNLIPLCKNHHWEFDTGFLIYEKGVIKKVKS